MVRVLRVRAGLTQEQLAELSGLSVRAISDIERGTTLRPRRSSIALLEAALRPFGENGTAPAAVRQLPPAVPGFTGRARELDALTHLPGPAGTAPGPAVISAIAGTAGVGKTALALHWAHGAADRFPDGQLYVNLRGYDRDRPVPAASARLDLDLLPMADAVALLRTLIGGRADADRGAAEALARQCSRLPLALRVAAEFVTARPGVSLASLASELADQQRWLDLLDADGDPRAGVRAMFSWSYRDLGAVPARMFRLLGGVAEQPRRHRVAPGPRSPRDGRERPGPPSLAACPGPVHPPGRLRKPRRSAPGSRRDESHPDSITGTRPGAGPRPSRWRPPRPRSATRPGRTAGCR
jgi:helix-turn-helix protein